MSTANLPRFSLIVSHQISAVAKKKKTQSLLLGINLQTYTLCTTKQPQHKKEQKKTGK